MFCRRGNGKIVYSALHEHDLSKRPNRYPVGVPAALSARVPERLPNPTSFPPHHSQRHLLCPAYWLSLALLAEQLSTLANGVNGLITNDKFCWTRRGALSLSWHHSHPLPRARSQDSPAYAPPDDRRSRHRRGGRYASSPPTPMAPAPSAGSAFRRTAALGSSLPVPHAVDSAAGANPARTGGQP